MVLLGVLAALLIAGLLVGGIHAWWLAGRTFPRPRPRRSPRDGRGSEAPTGPDDDPEFISALERLIRGEDPGGLA